MVKVRKTNNKHKTALRLFIKQIEFNKHTNEVLELCIKEVGAVIRLNSSKKNDSEKNNPLFVNKPKKF
jgi:hypothetical protein